LIPSVWTLEFSSTLDLNTKFNIIKFSLIFYIVAIKRGLNNIIEAFRAAGATTLKFKSTTHDYW
jgi:hypothetical protein